MKKLNYSAFFVITVPDDWDPEDVVIGVSAFSHKGGIRTQLAPENVEAHIDDPFDMGNINGGKDGT